LAIAQQGLASVPVVCGAVAPAGGEAAYNILPFARNQVFNVSKGVNDGYILFSLCTAEVPPCNATNSSSNVYAVDFNEAGECNTLATEFSSVSNVSYTNDTNIAAGFVLAYPPAVGSDYTLNVSFICDESDTDVSGDIFAYENSDDDTYLISANSYYGCAYLDVGQFIAFMTQYEVIFIIIFILFGIFLIGWGLKMFNITIFLVTAVVGTFASGSLFYSFTSYSTAGGILWVVFFVSVLIGCVLGYLAVKFEKVGFFGLGFCLGGVGGMVLFNSVILPFLSATENFQWLFYVVVCILAVCGGLLALWIWKDVIIIATSVIGSYMVVRSFSVIFGGFPAETAVASGQVHFSGVAYAYLAVMVILAIGGIVHQERQKKLREDNNEEANMENIYKNMA
jgi:MFS family permease